MVARVGFMISFLGRVSFDSSCFGIIVFCFMEWIRVEVAKSPVRRGSRVCGADVFRVASPKNPASRKIIIAFIFDSFSVRIKNIDIQIRAKPIMRWRKG